MALLDHEQIEVFGHFTDTSDVSIKQIIGAVFD